MVLLQVFKVNIIDHANFQTIYVFVVMIARGDCGKQGLQWTQEYFGESETPTLKAWKSARKYKNFFQNEFMLEHAGIFYCQCNFNSDKWTETCSY